MSRWNPGNPDRAGDEWYGITAGVAPISQSLGQGPTILATTSESVDEIDALIRGGGVVGDFPGQFGVDVYDLADPLVDTNQWIMAVPASNFTNADGWEKSNSGVVTPYDSAAFGNVATVIATSTPINTGAATQLIYPLVGPTLIAQILFLAGNANFYDGDTGAAGASLTSKRIGWVEVVAVVENDSPHSVRLDGFLNMGGSARFASDTGPQIVPANSGLRRLRFGFFWHPITGLTWANADAVSLTNGTHAYGVGIITKSGSEAFRVTSCLLQFRTMTERRVATGFGAAAAGTDAWVPFPLVSVDDMTTPTAWSKTSGHRYFVVFTQAAVALTASGLAVDTSGVAGHGSDLLTDTTIGGAPLEHGAVPVGGITEVPGQYAALLMVSGSPSLDSLPYADVQIFRTGATDLASLSQRISTGSAQAYGTGTLVIGADPNGLGGVLQDQPLSVALKRVSDNAVLAGPTLVQPGDVPADGKWHVVNVHWDTPATLTGGEAVYIEVASTSTVGWPLPGILSRSVNMSVADATSLLAAIAGIGGTTDYGLADTTLDFPWSMGVSPSPPTGFTGVPLTIPNQPALAGGGLIPGIAARIPTTVGFAALAWDATSLGGVFGFYELQRQNPATSAWETIAQQTGEAPTPSFDDFECPRNVALNYRLRVVRSDGGASSWVTVAPFTVPTVRSCDVMCGSNWAENLSLAFEDLGGVHAFVPLQAGEGIIHRIYGRDDPVAFYPAEAGGEEFTRDLAIAFNDPAIVDGGAVEPDRTVFDPLIALMHDRSLPYVAYCDGWGNVWYASPKVTGMSRTEPAGQYRATVVFTQVASVPAPYVGPAQP